MGRCGFSDAGIDRTCAEARAFGQLRRGLRQASSAERRRVDRLIRSVAFEQLRSDKPGLRHWAALRLLGSVHAHDKVLPSLLTQANREQQPVVLLALVKGVVSGWRRGTVYRDYVITAGSHPVAAVRALAMRGLGEMQGNARALRILTERMERDPDPRVRRAACRFAGQHGDERLVPVYRRVMARVHCDARLYAACLEGLLEMWNPLRSSKHRWLSRRAYKLTLWALRRRPYTADHPNPMALMTLGRRPRQTLGTGVRPPAWYRKGDVVAVLVAVVLAPRAPVFNRGRAISALAALGAARALEKLIAPLQGGADSDSRYLVTMVRRRLSAKP